MKHGVTKGSNHPETRINHSVENPESIIDPVHSQVDFNQGPMSGHIGAQRFRAEFFEQGLGLGQHRILTKPSNDIVVAGNIHGKGLRVRLGSNLLKSRKGKLKVSKLEAVIDHNIKGVRVNSLEIGRGVIVQHVIKKRPSLRGLGMVKQGLQQDIAGGRGHPKLAVQQGPVGVHGILVPALAEEPFHKSGIDNAIIDEATLLELVEEFDGLVEIVQMEKARNEIVVNEGISTVALREHLAQEVQGFRNALRMDQTFGEMAIGDGGGAEGGVGDHVPIHLKGHVHSALVAVGVDHVVVGHDVRDDVRLLEEKVEERNGLLVAP